MTGQLLLDVSRSTARRLSGKTPSGIDRVADAYCRHYEPRARAVLQLRGRKIIFGADASRRLFDLLAGPRSGLRRSLPALLASGLVKREGTADLQGALYLNVSHTNFDLPTHQRWVARRSLRPVYFVHDMIPVRYPEFSTPYRTARNSRRALAALRHGAGIITNSQASLADLTDFAASQALPMPPAIAVHPGTAIGSSEARWRPESEPYFVVLGTIEPRKNHALLLRIWERLAAKLGSDTPRLVIVGQKGFRSSPVMRQLAASPALSDLVDLRCGLDDAEVTALLCGARALLLPTLAEGYGMPLVEALQLGVPVIASDLPVFRETGQGLPTLVSAENEEDWQAHIESMADGANGTAGTAAFRPTTWEQHFASVDGWLDTLAQSSFERQGLPQHNEGSPVGDGDRELA